MARDGIVRLVLPFLIALGAASAADPQAVEVRREGDRVDIFVAGRPFTSYHFGPATAKPYLSPLRTAQGTVVTRSFPMADVPGEDHDEPHQRAMYFAHGDINGYDFWGEAEYARWSHHSRSKFGRTVIRELDKVHSGAQSGSLQAQFDSVTSDGTVIASETQAYNFSGDEAVRIIDCEFTIHASRGPVRIGDTKEGTFAIRLSNSLVPPAGQMVNSAGGTGEKEIWGKRADWVNYDGSAAGEAVGLAIFDHPENPRHPTYWHARRYGLLAANPFGLKEFLHDPHQDGSYIIPEGGSMTLRYRVFIHHGDFREARVAEAYKQYANME